MKKLGLLGGVFAIVVSSCVPTLAAYLMSGGYDPMYTHSFGGWRASMSAHMQASRSCLLQAARDQLVLSRDIM
jgi:hypothetical protein